MVRAIEKGVVRDLLNKLAKYLGEGTSRKAAKGNFRCFSFFATLSFSCKRSTGGTVRAARLAAVEFLNGGQLETPYTSSPMSRLATFFRVPKPHGPPTFGWHDLSAKSPQVVRNPAFFSRVGPLAGYCGI